MGALPPSSAPLQPVSAASRLSSLSKRWPCEVEVGEWPRLAASGTKRGHTGCTDNLLHLAVPSAGFTTAVLSARRRRRRLSGTLTAASYAHMNGAGGCVKWRVYAPRHRRLQGHQRGRAKATIHESYRHCSAAAAASTASAPASASAPAVASAAASAAAALASVAAAAASAARWRVPCSGHRAIRARC
eukprot:scaffold50915_cov66-Phaeocystis_antarctica.AAC.3